MATKVIRQFGGEGFSTPAEMQERVDLGFVPTGTTFHMLSEFGTTNEQWVAPNATSGLRHIFVPSATLNPRREVEVSGAIHIANITGTGGSAGGDFILIDSMAALEVAIWPEDSTGTALRGDSSGFPDAVPVIDDLIRIEAGNTFYVTVRVREETNSTANDGEVEVFVGGVLIYYANTINTGSISPATINFNEPSSAITTYFRNCSIRDGWSTPDGVAPNPIYIEDIIPTSVTSTYAITGTAATQLDAITDGDDTTSISTSTVSDQAVLNFTPDPVLAGFPVQSISLNMKASKNSISTNIISIDLEDGGVAIAPTENYNIASIAPNVDNFFVNYDLTVPTVLSDIDLVVSNGS